MKELLKKLVSINSIFPKEKELSLFLFDYLKNLGFSVELQEVSKDRFNVLAVKGNGDKSLLLYGHLDTVPIYGEWKSNPFIIHENGDILRGLGVVDMKGGIAAILKSIESFNGYYKLKIAFCVDEENISEGAHFLLNSGWCSDVTAVIVTEMGSDNGDGTGPNGITLGRRGRAAYTFKVHGVSAHGATNDGINAIEEASKIIMNLKRITPKVHSFLPRGSLFVRSISSDSGSLSIPDYCEFVIDRHLVPPENKESVLNDFKNFINNLYEDNVLRSSAKNNVEVCLSERKTPYLDPYLTDEFDNFTIMVSKFIKNKFGEVKYRYGLSVADENIFASLKIPVLTIGPKGGNEHSSDEWVSYNSIIDLSEILSDVIMNFSEYLMEDNKNDWS